MNFKPEEKVRYIGQSQSLKGCIGYVVDDFVWGHESILDDEVMVDFGVEDECIEIVKEKDLEMVKE